VRVTKDAWSSIDQSAGLQVAPDDEHARQDPVDRSETVTPDTPLFWSTWGRRSVGKVRAPTGKNVWRLCKVYGRMLGYPELKPHDLRHGVAMEVLEQHHDLEQVRALLGHALIDATQIYASIRPPQLKRAVSFTPGFPGGQVHPITAL
jgi:integrase